MDRDPCCDCLPIALTLVAMMMCMKNCVNPRYADLAEQLQDVAGAEVDEQRAVPISQHINIAGVTQHIQVRRNLRQSGAGNKSDRRASGYSDRCGCGKFRCDHPCARSLKEASSRDTASSGSFLAHSASALFETES